MLLLGLFIVAINLGISGAQSVGVCYGMMGNNLPSKSEVVALYKANNINRMRLYDPNHEALNALRGSNIELADPSQATSWVQQNVVNFWPSVRFKYIAVGNEVSPISGNTAWLAQFVLPALVNVFNAVRSAGLQDQIKVSTAIDTTLIGKSFPPSEGAFRGDIRGFIEPIVGHLVWAKTPLLANIYPYFSHRDNPGLGYQNLFDAILDALYSSLEGVWGGSLDVVVSESGWPSAGGFATSDDNARTYLSNLIRHVKKGSPKRPNKPIETYIFAMFNENQKQPELEKHFGVFFPDKRPKYNLNFGGERIWDFSAEHNATLPLVSDIGKL
ncbi:hypothetical protein F8388_012932 [Cannabis sativa]|uniref:glucan endo-1,3-beta-D-glucosidase n=1 Tax=Cannabis sativa TaxID=3483 RepID=A0A7J6ESR2_CANSA|nr:hypothetical protein F8388_012932 [Cannabis sativa]